MAITVSADMNSSAFTLITTPVSPSTFSFWMAWIVNTASFEPLAMVTLDGIFTREGLSVEMLTTRSLARATGIETVACMVSPSISSSAGVVSSRELKSLSTIPTVFSTASYSFPDTRTRAVLFPSAMSSSVSSSMNSAADWFRGMVTDSGSLMRVSPVSSSSRKVWASLQLPLRDSRPRVKVSFPSAIESGSSSTRRLPSVTVAPSAIRVLFSCLSCSSPLRAFGITVTPG